MRKRTPQEKKKLSYDRDRRNTYGEAPHAARKNIPLQKARRNRANRRLVNQDLSASGTVPPGEVLEEIEGRLGLKPPKDWKKCPDTPLGEVLAEKSRGRKVMRENGGRDALRTITRPTTNENT